MAKDPSAQRPKRKRRWVLRGLGIIVLLMVLAGIAGYFWQRGSLPKLAGDVRVEGLRQEASLSRSAEGLLFVKAQSEADAAFALGYAHAQDRLFQMDTIRRLVAGRLSEVVGDSTVSIDKFFRTLGLYRLAEENLQHLSPDTLAALESYAAGVNAFLETHEGPLPLAFTILGYEPEPWRPADSVAWGRAMALVLSSNYREELIRARLLALTSEEKVKQLYPNWPDWAPTSVPSLQAMEQRGMLQDLIEVLPWEVGPKQASNAWAVSPARSSTGGALMAGDPHLSLRAPGDWYLARIETPDLTLAGGTAAGLPLMIFGHNGSLSWSFTTTYSDTQDLFIEEVDPEDPTRYRTKDGWREFESREETILVSGEDPVTITVRKTYHGPVISDVVEDAEGLVTEHQVLALAWTALDSDDRSADGLFGLNRAADVPAAIEVLRLLESPQQTMVLADSEGSIALLAPGRVPIRKAGDGLLPVPGAEGAYDWIGEIPYDALPRAVDPESGVLLTANNKLVGDDYPYLIAAYWNHPDRARRIEEMLREKEVFTPDDMREMQLDTLSQGASYLLPRLLQADLPAEAEAAIGPLRDWDYRMEMDAPEPLIYSAWLRALERQLLRDELGEVFPEMADGDAWRVFNLLGADSLWCDDVATTAVETCDQQIAASLEAALKELVDAYGDDVDEWQWGKAHYADFTHPVLRYIPLVGSWTAITLPAPGGQDTVNRAGSDYSKPFPQAFIDRHGPGFRGVFDMADPDASGVIISMGNSENIFSPYYGNLAQSWRDGELLRLPKDVPAGARTLTLLPK